MVVRSSVDLSKSLFKSLKAVNPRGQMERQPSSKKKREDGDSAVQMGR